MKMDFRGVPGMGKTIEEKMREYNELKGAVQNYSKNKETYKKQSNDQLKSTPWGVILLIAFICILAGAAALYAGISDIKRAIVTADERVFITAEIESVWSRTGHREWAELEIEYYVDGKRYEDKVETTTERDQFMIGQPISVYYYKNKPSEVYLTSDEINGYFAPIIGVVFIAIGFVAIFAKMKAGNAKRKR